MQSLLTALYSAVFYILHLKVYTANINQLCIKYTQLDLYLEKNFYCEYGGECIISVAQDLIKDKGQENSDIRKTESKSKIETDVDMMSL